MVHFAHVAEFVNQDVTDEVGLDEEQFEVQANRAAARATSPATFLTADRGFDKCDSRFNAESAEPRVQCVKSLASRPALKHGMAPRQVLDRTHDSESSLAIIGQADRRRRFSLVFDTPLASECGEQDFRRQGLHRFRSSALASRVNFRQGRLDPFLFIPQEMRDQRPVKSARNNDLQAPINRHPQAHILRAGTLTNLIIKMRPHHF